MKIPDILGRYLRVFFCWMTQNTSVWMREIRPEYGITIGGCVIACTYSLYIDSDSKEERKSMEDKIRYMRRALELAAQGVGYVNPNPMVGCVVVKDGRIIAEGYHHRCGEYHAERNALLNCQEDPMGADLYVTLEPCCHHGKTPPCTDIILEKKIGRVFVGAMDSNPLVGGKGVQILRDHGIYVETGILEEECRRQNEVFFHNMEHHRPFIAMKYAMTLDGKIACATGDSRWVTGEEARHHVHELRHRYMGIMVGIGTVMADDPMLNCRIPGGKNPVRIVCDSHLRIRLDSQLVQTAQEIPTILVTTDKCSDPGILQTEEEEQNATEMMQDMNSEKLEIEGEENLLQHKEILRRRKLQLLKEAGVRILFTKGDRVDLQEMLLMLKEEKIDSILLEGGGTLNASFLEAGLVDRVYAYIAPKLVGGSKAKTPVEGRGIPVMAQAVELENLEMLTLGKDICLTGRVSGAK